MTHSTADILDADVEGAFAVCELELRQYGGIRTARGTIRTVRCLEDNTLVKELVSTPGNGQILVIDGGGSRRTALLGDNVGRTAAEQGWAALIFHGCVRDTAELAGLPIVIKAIGTNPRRSGKAGIGEIDVPVTFGGVTFHPGSELVTDDDGVIVANGPD